MTAEQVTLVPTENGSAGSKSSAKPVGKLQRPPTRLDWKANFSFESSLLHRPDLRTNIASSITDLIGMCIAVRYRVRSLLHKSRSLCPTRPGNFCN